jgi:transposase-like protein
VLLTPNTKKPLFVFGTYSATVFLALHNRGMICINCQSNKVCKNGHRRGKQNYLCRDCGKQFLEFYSPKGYPDSIKEQCLTMYVNGLGFRAIERITGVNHNTVINWVKQVGFSLPDAPDYEEIPEVAQLDELQTFVAQKKIRFGYGRLSTIESQVF